VAVLRNTARGGCRRPAPRRWPRRRRSRRPRWRGERVDGAYWAAHGWVGCGSGTLLVGLHAWSGSVCLRIHPRFTWSLMLDGSHISSTPSPCQQSTRRHTGLSGIHNTYRTDSSHPKRSCHHHLSVRLETESRVFPSSYADGRFISRINRN
jgi:hypothetical protein